MSLPQSWWLLPQSSRSRRGRRASLSQRPDDMKPASITRAALSLFALLLWASSADSIRFWRRRRRSCRAVNCQWKNWSAWGPCNHPCGSAGSQRRTRGVATQPACNGAACPGVSAETRGCNRGCDHGGTERVGFCLCPPPRWGTCCETRESIVETYSPQQL